MCNRLPALGALLVSLCLVSHAVGQAPLLAQPHARVTQTISEASTVALTGNVHPLVAVSASNPLDDGTPMEQLILFLKPDATQEATLAQLITQQNDPKSPLFHRFLTPQDFGAQFGVAQSDMVKVTAWLQGHGFTVGEVPAGQRAILFSGNSGQVANAFKTEIRRYTTAGVNHTANATDPQIPAALSQIVGGVVKLHDFKHKANSLAPVNVTSAQLADPKFTYGSDHYLAPADYATIYNMNPLYSGSIDGTGQSIAVLARSNINLSDVQSFRSSFGLKPNAPQIVIANSDPGVLQGDSVETTLDTEWSGAIARGANVKVIVAASTNTADGIDLSALYAVNHNVAPILSLSYGSCEADMGASELAFYNSLWQQAAAQGMSVFVSSGDSGSAGCDSGSAHSGSRQAINGLCSSPYATCVGGTEFVEGSNPGQYWLPGNNPAYGSAIGYVPEKVWNESASGGGSGLWAGGGGASILYPKPSWQTGPGVPADGRRDVPDVSLTAAGHDGYLIVLSGGLNSVGGTSAAAPSFAGLMALVNQKMNARQGLANTILYQLAVNQTAGAAAVFHDISSGNNSVPGVNGFSATTGYDLATGLGSVDAAQLVNHWADATKVVAPTISLAASSSALTVKIGQSAQTIVTSTASSSLKSAVTLLVTGAPAGVTAAFAAATVASPGSGSVALNVDVNSSAKPGTYSLAVAAQGGAQSANLTISLVIPAPTFTFSAGAASVNAIAGNAGQVSVSITPQNGFASAVTLSVTGLPAGVTAAFSPATLSGAATASSVLTLTVAKSLKAGSYTFIAMAAGGGVTQTSSLALVATVTPSCTLTSNPSSVSLTAGQSAAIRASCGTPQGTFSGPLALSLTGAPAGVTASSATLVAGSSTNLNVGASLSAAPGRYTLSLTVSGSGFTQTLPVALTISAPSTFTLTAGPTALTLKPGATGQLSVATAHLGTFNSAIALSLTGLPSGVTASLSKSTLAAPGDGTAAVAFAVASSAPPGTYTVAVTGTGGGQTQTALLTLTIAAAQGFSFALNNSAITVQQGGAGGTVIVSTGNFTGGFNSTITISFGGLAVGMNYGSLGATTGNNLVNVSERLTAATYTPVGTYPITITASGAGIVHSAVVQMTVTAAAPQTHR